MTPPQLFIVAFALATALLGVLLAWDVFHPLKALGDRPAYGADDRYAEELAAMRHDMQEAGR